MKLKLNIRKTNGKKATSASKPAVKEPFRIEPDSVAGSTLSISREDYVKSISRRKTQR